MNGPATFLACAALGAAGSYPAWAAGRVGAVRAGADPGSLPPSLPLLGACSGALGACAAGAPAAITLALLAVVTAAAVDLRCGLIPDRVVFPAALLIVALRACDGAAAQALLGAVLVAALFALPFVATRGRGFGAGDVKLGIVVGAALGCGDGVLAAWCSFVAGGVLGAAFLLARRARRTSVLPFGPCIAAGTALTVAVSALPARALLP